MGEGSREYADTLPASSPPEHAIDGDTPPEGERYRLGAELGRGGMGRVVEAFDTQLGRTVALKEVLPSGGPAIVRRFQREVQITARLEHASIVPLYDAGTSVDGRPYYVMRRVTGRPLDQLIERTRALADRLALLPNMLAAIDAIAHAHKRGVIHRDLKPQNILVGELGETVVIDWGLAKVVGESDTDDDEPVEMPTAGDSLKTQVGSVFGTPGFMAPEQARGEALDQRGDVFALGATLYHVVVGKPPVTGKSATEMIVSTLQHKIIPVSRAAPGVPAELVAIVDKALAADPKHRYAHAGDLAEDLRRFLTGQLVAAHRYTSWQRFTRFAKRHRAVLGVATAASVVLAILAWVSVHRVLTERDAARAARADAEAQRVKADQRATQLKAQTDRLVLAHARSLLDTNPTEVVALMKDVDPSPESRALVRAAVTRGVAWALPSLKGQTTGFEMASDGKHVMQLTFEGELQIIDLDARRVIVTKHLGAGVSARWAGSKLFIVRNGAPPDIFDPTTGKVDTLAMLPVLDVSVTEAGDHVAYVDEKLDVGIIDVATRAVTPLWTSGRASRDVEIARDGSFVAFGEGKPARLVVVDRAGKQIVDYPGDAVAMAVSASGKLAVSFYDQIVEIEKGKVTKVPLDGTDAKLVHYLVYRGDVLAMIGMRNVLTWGGYAVNRSEPLGDTVYYGVEAGGKTLVVGASDNAVHLLRDGVHLAVPLTSRPKGIVRIAAQRRSTRIAAVAGDAVLLWDIADLLPHLVPTMAQTFIDKRTVLQMGGTTPDWTLVDVDTGATRSVPIRPFGMAVGLDVADDGRFAAAIEHGGPDGKPAITTTIVSADKKTLTQLSGSTGVVKLVPGEGVVAAATGGKVLGKLGSAVPKELVTVDGEVVSLCATGPRAYAALSSAGELVKGTLDGKIAARTRIDMKKSAFIVCAGDVVIASGNELLRWRGDVELIARFVDEPAGTIRMMWVVDAGFVMTLANGETYFVAAQGDQTPRRLPLTGTIAVSVHGNLVASLAVAGQVELVELPSLAMWSLPRGLPGATAVALSPDGQRLAATYGGDLAVSALPPVGRDDEVWLDELTNATLVNGQLQWPWQHQTP
jgi:hypothetical protein